MFLLLRNRAKARTVDIPRRFKISFPSPALLSQEAPIMIASLRGPRGEAKTAYAFVPTMFFATIERVMDKNIG